MIPLISSAVNNMQTHTYLRQSKVLKSYFVLQHMYLTFVFSLIEKQIVLYARSDELTLAQWGFPGNAFELLQTSSFRRYIPNFQSSWYGIKVGRKFFDLFFSNSTSEKLWSYCGWAAFHQRYTFRVLQTIQMKLILLCVWVEPADLGSAKTALKFKY